jgi:hypothetical protein
MHGQPAFIPVHAGIVVGEAAADADQRRKSSSLVFNWLLCLLFDTGFLEITYCSVSDSYEVVTRVLEPWRGMSMSEISSRRAVPNILEPWNCDVMLQRGELVNRLSCC